MRINFSDVDDVQDYSPVPEDTYRCRLIDVTEGQTQYGDDMWKLRFEILEGEYRGRLLFDNLVINARSMSRVKLLCSHIGLDVTGELDLTPNLIVDRVFRLQVFVEEYQDRHGETKKRNRVPYAGFLETSERDSSVPRGQATDPDLF